MISPLSKQIGEETHGAHVVRNFHHRQLDARDHSCQKHKRGN